MDLQHKGTKDRLEAMQALFNDGYTLISKDNSRLENDICEALTALSFDEYEDYIILNYDSYTSIEFLTEEEQ